MDGNLTTEALLSRLMSAAQLRARVISSNIANQNTPGYKRREVLFEDLLRDSLQRGLGGRDLSPKVVLDQESPARPDGNNVNMEMELNALRENRILFETYASIVEGRGSIKRAALGGAG